MSWSYDDRQKFAHDLVLTAKFYDKDLPFDVAKMIVDDVCDLDFNSCLNALVLYRRNKENRTWPKSADIRAIVNPKLDSRAFAVELARKIDRAVSKHGWNWSQGVYGGQHEDGSHWFYWNDSAGNAYYSFQEAAIAELGDIGWHAICSRGGWSNVTSSANDMEEGMFIAQMRDQIQSSILLAESGVDITRIEMPKKPELDTKNGDLERGSINILEYRKKDGQGIG